MKSRGALVIARNNTNVDYLKQAAFLAQRLDHYLNIPTSVVTDSPDWVAVNGYMDIFDRIIPIVWEDKDSLPGKNVMARTDPHYTWENVRRYYDGVLSHRSLPFKNEARTSAYDATPYDETLLIDSDMFIMNDDYKHCFEQDHNFLIYDKSYDLAGFRDPIEFKYISRPSIKFYWATVVFFRRSKENEIFFELLKHIQDNWYHYRAIFQIPSALYRNDFAFSIAIHIMNGYEEGTFSMPMPGKLFFTTDKDILWDANKDRINFLLEKEDYPGEYTICQWRNENIHVMNKFSLERYIDKVFHV